MDAEIRTFSKGTLLKLVAAVTALVVLASGSPLLAQSTTGSLAGVVRDVSGSVVPDATVTVRNIATGFTQTMPTEAGGAFLFSLLPVGDYELRVEKPGFQSYVQAGIRLSVDRAASQNVTLQVGQVTEQVTVQAEAELVTTRTATAGQLVDEKRIVELPLNGRRPERLIYLAAGTVDLGRNSCQICGHGAGVHGPETPAALREALATARRRLPRAWIGGLRR